MLSETFMDSPFGQLHLIASENGLAAVLFEGHREGKVLVPDGVRKRNECRILYAAKTQLEEYFLGKRRVFEISLDPLGGTAFQRLVWASLQKIPYGHKVTYAFQAEKFLGNKNATRAVALANSKNPVSIVVPCHRVVGADGKLRGYAGGLHVKEGLLRLELSGL